MAVYGDVQPAIKEIPNWLLQTDEGLHDWIKRKDSPYLCIDGATKGNLGNAGARGVIWCPSKQVIKTFAFGLGTTTNNET